MKNTKGLISVLAVSTMLSGLTLPASADTLKQALAKAYENNPTLLAQREALKATDEFVSRARAGYRPTLNGSVTYGQSKSSDTTDPETGQTITSETISSKTYSVTARQSIFSGFQTLNSERQARENVKAARAQLLSVEQGVLLSAATAYLDVLRDMAVLDLNKNQVKVLTRQLQASQDRFRVGEITRTDVAQSEARLEGAKSNLRSAEAALSSSQAAYRRMVGEMPTNLSKPSTLPELPANLQDAIDTANEYAPAVQIARYYEKSAKYAVDSTRGQLYPSIGLQASISRSETTVGSFDIDPRTNKQIGIQMSVPLYQGGAAYSDIRRAKAVRSQRVIEIREAERKATEQAFVAWDSLRAATARIASSEAQVRANRIALDGVRQESAVGSRTTLDVLNQEQELLNAQVSLIRAQRDELVAAYSLLASMGKLTAQSLGLSAALYNPDDHLKKVKNKFIGG